MTQTMTNTIELGKAEFWTIESHYISVEDDYIYEEERNEDIDTYWFEQMGGTLDQYFQDQCDNNLDEDTVCRVSLIPRRWATIEDGIPTDYGDDCLGREDFIWNGKELITEDEYIESFKSVR